MRKTLIILASLLMLITPTESAAWHRILKDNVKSLEVILNNDFTALPVMQTNSRDVLRISFDELSHNYHRFVYHIEPCNPDWTPVEGLFDSDWLVGFNDLPIDDYENSLNTNVLYTHYQMQLPNEQTRLKMSGNYRLHIFDEDDDGEEVACVEFRVVEPLMNVGIGVTTNTDVDFQNSHQQVQMTVNYNGVKVTNVEEQLQVFVMQNGREDNMKEQPRPNYINQHGLRWEHNRQLIFEAGNEYRKFEVLDPTRISLGLASVSWDESQRRFHAFTYPWEPRRSYLYDEDADGTTHLLPESGSFYQTQNSYQGLVYYKGTGERAWRLVGYQEIVFRDN